MHEKLQVFIGNWVESIDDKDFEKCEWFDGGKHVICSWTTEIEGNKISGKSILSYSTILEKFTYYGFNSLGRNSYQLGDYTENKFVFYGQIKKQGYIINSRTSLLFSEDGNSMEFSVEHEEFGNWNMVEKKTLIKLQ